MKSQFNDGSSGHSHFFIYNNIQLKFYFFTLNFALFLKIKLYIITSTKNSAKMTGNCSAKFIDQINKRAAKL